MDQKTPGGDSARCERCGNYSAICGHDLPFAERIRSVAAHRLWAASSH